MHCTQCGSRGDGEGRFCRSCGARLVAGAPAEVGRRGSASEPPRDPDELVGSGISKVITGDGFLMVALFLGVTHTSIGSLLWLLLLIPAFFLFGQGFKDVFRAQQIRRRAKSAGIGPAARAGELPPAQVFVADIITSQTTRGLAVEPRGRAERPQSS